jgi:phosphoglycerate dehydrogenase-like enzyme
LTICGFLGFGEVASRFAQRLHERGARVLAYDVLLDRPGMCHPGGEQPYCVR